MITTKKTRCFEVSSQPRQFRRRNRPSTRICIRSAEQATKTSTVLASRWTTAEFCMRMVLAIVVVVGVLHSETNKLQLKTSDHLRSATLKQKMLLRIRNVDNRRISSSRKLLSRLLRNWQTSTFRTFHCRRRQRRLFNNRK